MTFADSKIPVGWDLKACMAWAQQRHDEAIQQVLAALNAQAEKPVRLTLQLSYYLFLRGEYRAAAKFLYLQDQHTPNHVEVLLNLAVCLSRMQEYRFALPYALRVVEIDAQQYVAFDTLASAYYHLGDYEKARSAGCRSLLIKDQLAVKSVKNLKFLQISEATMSEDKERVIAFSLWGQHPRYLRGALHNMLVNARIYPNWICRFYVDNSVPKDLIDVLKELGAQIYDRSSKDSIGQKLCWRFDVANDPDVSYFLVRDVDSVSTEREAMAVNDWIASGKKFHIMRDWWTHTDLILAGMWGGRSQCLPSLAKAFSSYTSTDVATPNIDQWFLRDCVWAFMRDKSLIHDRCYQVLGSKSWPGPTPDRGHIGQNEYAVASQEQAKVLEPWSTLLPCLGLDK